ncbi:unnamed protein product [Mytilus edulis]|uniref:VWFA domain-containing protein n=1 Tax=Mytilus edulis TaxID=6550 RepID=A0A8S3UI13_MYTED|nr:unnamed protein product [Mytilus edulis]
MCRAFDKCIYIFNKSEYSDFKKCLFVLSDGAPSDVDKIRPLISGLKDANVKIISCYVGNSSNVEPKRLYNEKGKDWTPGAQFMFELSSTIQTQILPYVIFENAGWSIEKKYKRNKAFLQVNHPDHIHEACNVAKKIVSSQDALLSFLGSISLSRYINQVNKSATANMQVKETCYANAVAAVIHLATKRILNREGGYPDFFELRDEIIEAFGESGAVILSVLETFSKQFRLQYKKLMLKKRWKLLHQTDQL